MVKSVKVGTPLHLCGNAKTSHPQKNNTNVKVFPLLSRFHITHFIFTRSLEAAQLPWYWSQITVWSWFKLLLAALSLAGDWQEQILRQPWYCSWEGNLLGTHQQTHTLRSPRKHRQDCPPFVSIHFFLNDCQALGSHCSECVVWF